MGALEREVLELVPEGIIIVDAGGRITFANRRAQHHFGFPSEAPSLLDAVGEERASAWRSVLDRTQLEDSFSSLITGPGGLDLHVYAARRENGGFLLSLTDPPSLPEEQPLLRTYAEVLARHGVGLWRLDVPSGELWWSPKCYEMIAIPEGPISTEAYLECVHPDDRQVIGDHMAAAVSGQREYAPCFRVPTTDPEGPRHLQDRATFFERDASGELKTILGATLDRTELVRWQERCARLESELLEAERMHDVGQLAGAIAHDLNNVMTVVVGNAEMLREDRAPEPLDDPITRDMLTAARHASALSSRLLDFVRDQPLSLDVTELGQFIHDTTPFMRTLVSETIEMSFRTPEDDLRASIDRPRLEQALFNLVLNAAAATGPKGRISVHLERSGRFALLSVTDDGRGMSHEHMEHVFTPFFTTRPGGAGLGLASVRKVVEQHGGSVECTSSLGTGSTFTIRLPLTDASSVPADTAMRQAPALDESRMVWIVDDQPLIRIVAERLLTSVGYRARTFPSPTALLETGGASVFPDLVLSDVIMPHMTGPELDLELRSRAPHTRTLFMSGYADRFLDKHLANLRGRPLIRKPFTRDQLVGAVRQALSDPSPPLV